MSKYMVRYISLSLIEIYFKYCVYNQLEKQSEHKNFSKQLIPDFTPALFATIGVQT